MATETEKQKKGLLLSRIIKNGTIVDLNNARDVDVIDTKFTKSKNGRKAVIGYCQSVQEGSKPKEKYKCSIIGLEGEMPLSEQRCMFSCNCSRFMYVWEYALMRKGAAKIIFGNGEPPHQTNPHMLASGCKHLIALCRYLIKQKK